jgi:bifunctional DNA-binding transcriptional regulator/antitoxin component of YhaV-PrlF toxin-antitoxin module
MEAITISKRGTLTLPPRLRRQLGLDKLPNPVLLVEERDGGIFLRASTAVPVRDLPRETVEAWIDDDEAELEKLGLGDLRRR